MSKFGNIMNRLGLKGIAISAMLLSIFALSGHFVTANAQNVNWKLKGTYIYEDKLASHAVVNKKFADANGGYVEINVNGNPHSFCPGGVEVLGFRWQFDYSVQHVNPGGGIAVNLSGGQVAKSDQCKNHIAQMSYISVLGSSGGGNPHSPEFTRQIDGSRFDTGNGSRIWAAPPSQQNGIGSILMKNHPFRSDNKYAFFMVFISIRGGGSLKVVYLYEASVG